MSDEYLKGLAKILKATDGGREEGGIDRQLQSAGRSSLYPG